MTPADRVLSTPPTNTSALPVHTTRRRLLDKGGGFSALLSKAVRLTNGRPQEFPSPCANYDT